MIPFDAIPGIPPLFLAFVSGEASQFFPDPPTAATVEARAKELAARRGSAVVAAGQQAGLFGGPLLSLTKASAVARLAGELRERSVEARGVFWIASEDHDLHEVAQATLLVNGVPERVALPVPAKNFQPAGTVAVPPGIETIFAKLKEDPAATPGVVARFEEAWKSGRTFAEAFRATLEALLPAGAIDFVDPLDARWREGQIEFFRDVFRRADEIVSALDEIDRKIRAAGYEPQVSRAEHDFPAFVIEDGVRRKISWNGREFSVHGYDRAFTAETLLELVSRKATGPSAAALLRPVLQSHLFPVAAEVLGPSELAYHAQTAPLFDVLGTPRPVFLPRPHLLPRGARERRALEALGIADADLFRLREAAPADIPAVSPKIQALEAEITGRMGGLSDDVRGVDPTLEPVLSGAAEKISHQLSRLREKVEKAAERRDVERVRRLETIETFLTPGNAPADRVYGPLTYLLRFGDGFAPGILKEAECRAVGARFVDFE